ncbi:5'-methylthioadenosine/S-adenosylhomocysteine nucleosidase family protein [Methanosarcina mazei]|uniref:Nucleoside phosphorylase domain-containing protein n=1 Tax=Methanosarcina mazei TaxID=2209 RepID=A0A0F8IY84_METMZ|nr:hypothetical protein [Methanosarcina mazei]KKG94567.1 hypothetical protein DU69_13880 [Methanosarcina mazei]
MPISKKKALELIDEKIKQFQHILNTATYDTRYNAEYHEAYYGTEGLLKELFSEEEVRRFSWSVSASSLFAVVTPYIDYEKELLKYKNHISKCISQLNVYKEKIQNFWEEPEVTKNIINNIMNQMADVLLVTATKIESKAVLKIFQDATSQVSRKVLIDDWIYHNIGTINGNRVFMVQSEMGSGGLGASQYTVQKGITDLSPNAVIMVGIAFGVNSRKQSIGEVLVSRQILLYEPQRIGEINGVTNVIPRGDKAHASPRLLQNFQAADVDWDESNCKVSFGLILSGEKLVDNKDFLQNLCDLEPEAIGGEMEGAGLYASCQHANVDWILVKSICDWADGNKNEDKDSKQKLAAENAASFVLHVLQQVPFIWKDQEFVGVSSQEPFKTNANKIHDIQKSEKIKDTAKALDIKLAKFSGSKYQQLAERFKNESKSAKNNVIDILYSQNDIDFLSRYDISIFDYNLSSEINQFFDDLSEAENSRVYIKNNYENPDPQIQTLCMIKYQNMKFYIISSISKVEDIRSQLKKIYAT